MSETANTQPTDEPTMRDHGVEKLGIETEPLTQLLDALELKEETEHRTVYANPLGVDCPCCGERFNQMILGTGAWTIAGSHAPLQVCIGDTPDGRIVFAHVLEADEQ